MLKHLNETLFQSGINTLYSSEAMHDTYYKQIGLVIEKTVPLAEDVEMLKLKWDIAYVTKPK